MPQHSRLPKQFEHPSWHFRNSLSQPSIRSPPLCPLLGFTAPTAHFPRVRVPVPEVVAQPPATPASGVPSALASDFVADPASERVSLADPQVETGKATMGDPQAERTRAGVVGLLPAEAGSVPTGGATETSPRLSPFACKRTPNGLWASRTRRRANSPSAGRCSRFQAPEVLLSATSEVFVAW